MVRGVGAVALFAILIVACSGGPAGTPAPGATGTPGAGPTATPAATAAPVGPTGQPNTGDIETRARALAPQGATDLGHLEAGGLYQLTLHSTMSLEQLEAFWDQAIPAQGMTLSGKFTVEGTLTIALTNPDGGIVAAPSDDGGFDIVISLGTST